VNTRGEFIFTNPETGSVVEDWGKEVQSFLDDNLSQWQDPENKKYYGICELECSDMGFSRFFLRLDGGGGEPSEKLLNLLKQTTGEDFKWMWTCS
jgi:hypothetical protein